MTENGGLNVRAEAISMGYYHVTPKDMYARNEAENGERTEGIRASIGIGRSAGRGV